MGERENPGYLASRPSSMMNLRPHGQPDDEEETSPRRSIRDRPGSTNDLSRKPSAGRLRPGESQVIELHPVYKSIDNLSTYSTLPRPALKTPDDVRDDGKVDMTDTTKSTANLVDGAPRDSWDNKLQYLLAVIGYAVGLGNVWRFPYLAQQNGGGAFLFPYLIMLALEGIPLLVLELGIGQRIRKGPLNCWYDVSHWMGGLGIAAVLASFCTSTYYNTIFSWCMYYLFNSFQYPLPWSNCPEPTTLSNGSVVVDQECAVSSSTQWFWYRKTLNIAENINEPGGLNWKLTLTILAAWLIIFITMIRGIKSSGKVVYFTATFPYLVLTIFLIRGVTLHGAGNGLIHLFTPDFSRLLDPEVWLKAATQIFFSLSLAGGGLIAMSSYMPPDNNFYQDALIVGCVNSFTSIYAGIVIFSIVGFKATLKYEECLDTRDMELMNLIGRTDDLPDVGDLVDVTNADGSVSSLIFPEVTSCDLTAYLQDSVSGTGLAFVTMTEAIDHFGDSAPFWAVLFFLMLLSLGLGSMFGIMQGVLTSLYEMESLKKVPKEAISGVLCLVNFILGLSFATRAGEYVVQIYDEYAATIPLLIIAFFECISVAWLYDLDRFAQDFELMIGHRPNWWWMLCWKYISPIAMFIIFIFSMYQKISEGAYYSVWMPDLGLQESVLLPGWGQFVCAFLTLSITLWIPLLAILHGINMLHFSDLEPTQFPFEDLHKKHNIGSFRPNKFEKTVFRLREVADGMIQANQEHKGNGTSPVNSTDVDVEIGQTALADSPNRSLYDISDKRRLHESDL